MEKIQGILREVTGRSTQILPEPTVAGRWATWSKFDLYLSHGQAAKMVAKLKAAGIAAFYRDNTLGVVNNLSRRREP